MGKQSIIVSDANVLIDMEVSGLTVSMFKLHFEFNVPDVLYKRELSEFHSHLLEMGLKISKFSGKEVEEVVQLTQILPKPSRMDLFALVLARNNKCILLTGDQDLRHAAVLCQVECHGTLWLVEKMVKNQIISIEDARMAYSKMRKMGSRLPWEEAEKRLEELKKQNDEKSA